MWRCLKCKSENCIFICRRLITVFGNLKPCPYLQEEGLHVYVDGLKAATDPSGTDRIYTFPKFDPWKKILLGKANDDRHPDPVPTLDIFNVTHFAKFYTFDQISAFYSKFKHFPLLIMNHFPCRFQLIQKTKTKEP